VDGTSESKSRISFRFSFSDGFCVLNEFRILRTIRRFKVDMFFPFSCSVSATIGRVLADLNFSGCSYDAADCNLRLHALLGSEAGTHVP
jgi:hypothetical protein